MAPRIGYPISLGQEKAVFWWPIASKVDISEANVMWYSNFFPHTLLSHNLKLLYGYPELDTLPVWVKKKFFSGGQLPISLPM